MMTKSTMCEKCTAASTTSSAHWAAVMGGGGGAAWDVSGGSSCDGSMCLSVGANRQRQRVPSLYHSQGQPVYAAGSRRTHSICPVRRIHETLRRRVDRVWHGRQRRGTAAAGAGAAPG